MFQSFFNLFFNLFRHIYFGNKNCIKLCVLLLFSHLWKFYCGLWSPSWDIKNCWRVFVVFLMPFGHKICAAYRRPPRDIESVKTNGPALPKCPPPSSTLPSCVHGRRRLSSSRHNDCEPGDKIISHAGT